MKYSVVIPYFNNPAQLINAINSVLNQTKKELVKEIIIVDDYSEIYSINRNEILEKIDYDLLDDIFIKVIRLDSNVGPGEARNYGIKNATTNFICFLDSDDWWSISKIEIIDLINQELKGNFLMIGHERIQKYNCSSEKNNQIKKFNKLKLKEVKSFKILFFNIFPTSSIVINKRYIKKYFEKGRRHSEDYLFILDNSLDSEKKSYFYEDSLAYMDKHAYAESGLGSNLIKMEVGELQTYKNILKNSKSTKFKILFPFIILFSVIKFFRRLIIVKLYSKRKKNINC